MNMTCVGDKLQFNKFKWVIVGKYKSLAGVEYYKYRVYRKYFKSIHLSNTECSYEIMKSRWDYYKRQLARNKNYHYVMK